MLSLHGPRIPATPNDASWAASRYSQRFRSDHLQRAFGVLLIVFSVWFVAHLR